MNQSEMFEQAMKRPLNYNQLSERYQWEVDDQLGILDWDGSCIHKKRYLCDECEKKYHKKYKI